MASVYNRRGIDLMNDPIADPPRSDSSKRRNESVSEPDHCRICRSEGTEEEPLFYPCKCSGSIKFVHQDCLTEWLKHSQKKHCELCKTPFHFTNVYDPNMPEHIPSLVFVSRIANQMGRTALFWARCVLVGLVWLGWLPWCVRWMWRFWFWLGDADWVARTRTTRDIVNATTAAVTALARETLTALQAGPTSSADRASETGARTALPLFPKLGNLSKSPFVNKLLYDIFEGQALAVAIFSCFFIVFLVREWVIQQQPEPGLGGGNDDVLAPRQLEQRNEVPAPAPGPAPAPVIAPAAAAAQPGQREGEPNRREYSLMELLHDAELRRQEKEAREHALAELESKRDADLDAWEGNASDDSSDESLRGYDEEEHGVHTHDDDEGEEEEEDEDEDDEEEEEEEQEEMLSTGNSSFEFVETPSNSDSLPQFTMRQPLPSNQRLAEAAASHQGSSSGSSVPRFDFGSQASTEWNNDGAPKPIFTFGAQANDSTPSLNFGAGEPSSSSFGKSQAEWLRDIEDRLHAPSRSGNAAGNREGDGHRETPSADQGDGVPTGFNFHINQLDQSPAAQEFLEDFSFENHDDDDEESDTDEEPGMNENGIGEEAFNAQDDPMGIDGDDDMDGVLELMGMRGPIVVLAQNAIISIVLLTVAVGMGVAVPYCWGRIVLLVLAHPTIFFLILPISLASFVGEFIVDTATVVLGTGLLIAETLFRSLLKVASSFVPALAPAATWKTVHNFIAHHVVKSKSQVALKLYGRVLVSGKATPVFRNIRPGYLPFFTNTSRVWWAKVTALSYWAAEKLQSRGNDFTLFVNATQAAEQTAGKLRAVAQWSEKWTGINGTAAVLDMDPYAPSYTWTAKERVLAVVAGYAFFTFLGALYLANSKASGDHRRAFERSLVELLQQAGGVMKVILIIGVEMIVFPLFCGVLLDVALLPLFENATLASRVSFGMNYPFTAVFLHWFVGTAYMFHFALFVAMCRRIMRNGVLYFIRDPDDPTFHPVKDVLDRPVLMQLRKIAYSALIYGFLVLFCLGSVVWGLHYSFNVLPIHWSSNEPVLEFPVDLLLYNFLMPVAVEHFQPSEVLEAMYDWWFRKCARALRLTSFMFGGRIYDEEVHSKTAPVTFVIERLMVEPPEEPDEEDATEFLTKDYVKTGRYVRAPAADSVRRAKGQVVFIPVTEDNKRLDGKRDEDEPETSPDSDKFEMVYVPPNFRTRLGVLVVLVWGFAAVTGVGITIGPLIIGRALFSTLVPAGLRTNDVYAFSIGIYILGAFAFAYSHREIIVNWSKAAITSKIVNWKAAASYIYKAAKVSYVFAAFALIIPSLFALMMELYIIMPLHTILKQEETHVIHFIQDWTLGVLYVKLMARWVLMDEESYWSRSLKSIIEPGYLNPDVKLATERFIFPAAASMVFALAFPAVLTYGILNLFGPIANPALETQVYRYSYPAVFVLVMAVMALRSAKGLLDTWRQNVRDEVYAIGQQLHNHRDSKDDSRRNSRSGSGASSPRASGAVGGSSAVERPAVDTGIRDETRPLLAGEAVAAN